MRRRTVIALAALVAALQPVPRASGRQDAAAARSPRNASYTLSASLDPAARTITGSGRLTWRNISRTPTSELRFHLYWNAWRNADSTWMRERQLARDAAPDARPDADWGRIDLSALRVAGRDALPRAAFISPDDGNREDRTVLSVPLDQPVAPGETIDIDLAWTSRVPRTFSRTGTIGNYFFIAQWFPKIGVLEDAGWNCHQFHSATEFFADFGTYDVTLTVPKGWTVGATGIARESSDAADGRRSHRFVEQDVHDFAWTTSPDFVERIERFEEPGLPPVDMRLLLQPEHLAQADRHFRATRAALKYYGTWFGPYPYSHITVVDPVTITNGASQGGGTGGMEYPTLFTAGTRWFAPWLGQQPEGVTVHEAGHQFWYGVVATNEFEHAWMDEGFNTFSTARVLDQPGAFPQKFVAVERYFGGLAAWAYTDVPWSRAIDGNALDNYRPFAAYDTPSTPTWKYWPGSAGALTYDKTALWLATLERLLGWETTQKILATHFQRGAFRHPTPEEFFAIANEISGRDLTWFFDAVYRSSATFDYGVAQVTSVPRGGRFEHDVVVRRFGDGIFPVAVRVTMEDGSVVTEQWDGRDRWRAFRIDHGARVDRVEVDPDRVLLLDVNYTNNSWSAHPRAAAAATKWSLRWLTWLEELLLTYAFFA